MSDFAKKLLGIYARASCGNRDAYVWLLAFHGWAHNIDDHVDESRPQSEVVDRCMEGVVLTSDKFYRDNAASLAPLLAVVADLYRWSLKVQRENPPGMENFGDAVRQSGNQVVVAVAYLCGGWEHAKMISDELWPLAWANQHGD